MVVGKAMAGKTTALDILKNAYISSSANNLSYTPSSTNHLQVFHLNPKSITLEQLYGAID